MSSENENTILESNIQYIIEDMPTIIEETVNSVVDIPVEFTLSHVEEMVQPDAGPFFSLNTEEPIAEMPLVVVESVAQVEEPVAQVVEEPVSQLVEEPVAQVEEPVVAQVEEPVAQVVEEPVSQLVEEPVAQVEEPVVAQEKEVPIVSEEEKNIPKLVFVVPYRDREQQYLFFSQHMKIVLEDIPQSDYEIYYISQCDNREFNRGAMKNIGFLYVKNKYPDNYKNITLVFNDIDTMPYVKNFLNYETSVGFIKHFYGFRFTLGGIVSINAGDFEKINGFPNFWAWGFEDNLLQKRALDSGLSIDRSNFYPLMDKNILQMKDGLQRIVNRSEFDRYMGETSEGIASIKNLNYTINSSTGFVNVSEFNTDNDPVSRLNTIHDLRKGNVPFNIKPVMGITGRRGRGRMGMNIM